MVENMKPKSGHTEGRITNSHRSKKFYKETQRMGERQYLKRMMTNFPELAKDRMLKIQEAETLLLLKTGSPRLFTYQPQVQHVGLSFPIRIEPRPWQWKHQVQPLDRQPISKMKIFLCFKQHHKENEKRPINLWYGYNQKDRLKKKR